MLARRTRLVPKPGLLAMLSFCHPWRESHGPVQPARWCYCATWNSTSPSLTWPNVMGVVAWFMPTSLHEKDAYFGLLQTELLLAFFLLCRQSSGGKLQDWLIVAAIPWHHCRCPVNCMGAIMLCMAAGGCHVHGVCAAT
jgi:hypothetical protein